MIELKSASPPQECLLRCFHCGGRRWLAILSTAMAENPVEPNNVIQLPPELRNQVREIVRNHVPAIFLIRFVILLYVQRSAGVVCVCVACVACAAALWWVVTLPALFLNVCFFQSVVTWIWKSACGHFNWLCGSQLWAGVRQPTNQINHEGKVVCVCPCTLWCLPLSVSLMRADDYEIP